MSPTTCPTPESVAQAAWSGRPESALWLHISGCRTCLAEWHSALEDRAAWRGACASSMAPAQIVGRALQSPPTGFPFRASLPAFRSGGVPVLHSAIHPLERDYVLLELSGLDGELQLHVERGTKNGPRLPISLYMDGELTDERNLQSRHSYTLGDLAPGRYALKCRRRTVFRFNVRE